MNLSKNNNKINTSEKSKRPLSSKPSRMLTNKKLNTNTIDKMSIENNDFFNKINIKQKDPKIESKINKKVNYNINKKVPIVKQTDIKMKSTIKS